MKNVISRVLTLVMIASTISNTTNCRMSQKQAIKETQEAESLLKTVQQTTAKLASAQTNQDTGRNVSQKEIGTTKKKLETVLNKAERFLQRVKDASAITKVLAAAVVTGTTLLAVDYGFYGGEYIAGPVSSGAETLYGYVTKTPERVKSYATSAKTAISNAGARVHSWLPSWRTKSKSEQMYDTAKDYASTAAARAQELARTYGPIAQDYVSTAATRAQDYVSTAPARAQAAAARAKAWGENPSILVNPSSYDLNNPAYENTINR